MCFRTLSLLLTLIAVCAAGAADARVFYSRSEALELAFPEADRVEDQTYILREDQIEAIESLSNCEMETKLVKVYTGYRGEDVLGYAFIDIHNVRTLPEAFLVVLNPEGDVRTLRVLAFHEPLEYKPADRWYSQFEEKSLDNHLRLGRDVHGIVGATLSARATTRGVRRALALYAVVVQNPH